MAYMAIWLYPGGLSFLATAGGLPGDVSDDRRRRHPAAMDASMTQPHSHTAGNTQPPTDHAHSLPQTTGRTGYLHSPGCRNTAQGPRMAPHRATQDLHRMTQRELQDASTAHENLHTGSAQTSCPSRHSIRTDSRMKRTDILCFPLAFLPKKQHAFLPFLPGSAHRFSPDFPQTFPRFSPGSPCALLQIPAASTRFFGDASQDLHKTYANFLQDICRFYMRHIRFSHETYADLPQDICI